MNKLIEGGAGEGARNRAQEIYQYIYNLAPNLTIEKMAKKSFQNISINIGSAKRGRNHSRFAIVVLEADFADILQVRIQHFCFSSFNSANFAKTKFLS